MARLIDADVLKRQLEDIGSDVFYNYLDGNNKTYVDGIETAIANVDDAETIDAVPVEFIENFIASHNDVGIEQIMTALVKSWDEQKKWN